MIAHLTDDALVRRADGELAAGEAAEVERHLAGCIPCRRELAEIEALSRRFSGAVALLDAETARRPSTPSGPSGASDPSTAPDPSASERVIPLERRRLDRGRRISPAWRVAAAIALTAGIGLALPPVRGWVAERLGLGTAPVVESPAPPEIAPGPTPDADLRVAFLPEGDRFVIRLSTPQRAGTLTLAAASGDEATAEIADHGGAAAELLVLPDGLAIRNRASSTADYRISIPREVSRIEVRIGERIVWSGSGERLRGDLSIGLSRDR